MRTKGRRERYADFIQCHPVHTNHSSRVNIQFSVINLQHLIFKKYSSFKKALMLLVNNVFCLWKLFLTYLDLD